MAFQNHMYKSLRPHDQKLLSHITIPHFNTTIKFLNKSALIICLNSLDSRRNFAQRKTREHHVKGEKGNTFFSQSKIFSLLYLALIKNEIYTHKQAFNQKVRFSAKSEFYLNRRNFKQSIDTSFRDLDEVARLLKNAMGFRF